LKNLLFVCLAAGVFAVMVHGADPARGKELFGRRCSGCHSLDREGEGPHLRGVYGRVAGKVTAFEYSAALSNAKFQWNDELLDKWLRDSQEVVKGNDMDFQVPDTAEREEIIAYLKSLPDGRK